MITVITIKENYTIICDKEWVNFVLNRMILFIKDNGTVIIFMVMEFIIIFVLRMLKMYQIYK